MATITFDTLTTARALEEAGIEREQAEAISKQFFSMASTVFEKLAEERALENPGISQEQARAIGKVEDLASKADLADLRADLYRALWIQGGTLAALVVAGVAAVGFS